MNLLLISFILSQQVPTLKDLYNRGIYDSVVIKADEILRDSTSAERVEIMKLKACALVSRGDIDKARQVFGEVLELDPLVVLNPRDVSPKIINIFEDVKRSHVWVIREKVRIETLYVKPSKKQFTLSLFCPGLGQVIAKRKKTGIGLIALEAASLSGILITSICYYKAHQNYVAETSPELIPAKYDAANQWYKIRIGFISTSALTYLYNLYDAAKHL